MTHPLADIEKKVHDGERLTLDDGVRLFRSDDLFALGRMANVVRERKNGNKAYYVLNMHLNYTNVCVHSCTFCYGAYAKHPGEAGGYVMNLDDVFKYAERIKGSRITEIHIVGGIYPKLPYKYYLDMLAGLKERHPQIHLKAFTAVEIDHLSRLAKKSVEETLKELASVGLDSMPGGGAEIFAPRVREKICDTKTDADLWLDIHRTAHRLGLRSTATMLYGHIESAEDRVDHMLRLRALQDETGGFTAFIPLAFHPANTQMADIPKATGLTDIKIHAIARLMLDNFDHIKGYWIMTGLKMAQLLLSFGVDDIDGTVVEEKIVHYAGAESPVGVNEEELRRLIVEAGRHPIQRDTVYQPVAATV